jgi:aerobic-type carbon monoxide dehydrogenase small subunit (CoxS/CutS family)
MITFTINGTSRSFDGDPDMPLLWYLRDELGLTGTKFGCGLGQCGACTVHVDGAATRACLTAVSTAVGKKITTIEGLSPTSTHPLQVAWVAEQVPQCGYCHPGRSCRPLHCCPGRRVRPTRRSTPPCPATSAGAAPINAFAAQFTALRAHKGGAYGKSS